MVRDQGDQRLPQRGGVAAHVCGPTRGWGGGRSGWVGPPLLGARPWPPARTHSRPGGPSPLSGTCVPRGRGCRARAGRWAGQTGSGQRSAPLSSPAGSGLGGREVGGQPAAREPETAEGGHGVTWGAARWATGLCPGRPRRELQATFPLLLTSSLPPPPSLPSLPGEPEDSPRPAWRLLPAHSPGRASPRSWSLGLNTEYSGYGMYFSMPNVCVTSVVRLKKCWPKTTETLSLGGLCGRGWWRHDPQAPEVGSPLPTGTEHPGDDPGGGGDAVQGLHPQTLGET